MKRHHILFINGSKAFSGALRSLYVFAKEMNSQIDISILCAKGTSSSFLKRSCLDTIECPGIVKFDNTEHGYYRGKRWLILLREFFYIPATVYFAFKLRKRAFDIIHVNEINDLPSGAIFKIFLKIPLVVHVRSRQNNRKGFGTAFQRFLIKKYADGIIAIDMTVAQTVSAQRCQIVHNALDVKEEVLRPKESFYPYGSDHLRVGFVANLMKDKGIFDFVKAAVVLKKDKIPCKLYIYGENLHENEGSLMFFMLKYLGYVKDVKKEIQRFVLRYDIEEMVQFKGFYRNLDKIYGDIDVVCFPSHLDAVGRPVIEGASWGIPSIVAFRSRPAKDTLIDKFTGMAVREGDAEDLAEAIKSYAKNYNMIYVHGCHAKALANLNFNVINNARKILDLYNGLLN